MTMPPPKDMFITSLRQASGQQHCCHRSHQSLRAAKFHLPVTSPRRRVRSPRFRQLCCQCAMSRARRKVLSPQTRLQAPPKLRQHTNRSLSVVRRRSLLMLRKCPRPRPYLRPTRQPSRRQRLRRWKLHQVVTSPTQQLFTKVSQLPLLPHLKLPALRRRALWSSFPPAKALQSLMVRRIS